MGTMKAPTTTSARHATSTDTDTMPIAFFHVPAAVMRSRDERATRDAGRTKEKRQRTEGAAAAADADGVAQPALGQNVGTALLGLQRKRTSQRATRTKRTHVRLSVELRAGVGVCVRTRARAEKTHARMKQERKAAKARARKKLSGSMSWLPNSSSTGGVLPPVPNECCAGHTSGLQASARAERIRTTNNSAGVNSEVVNHQSEHEHWYAMSEVLQTRRPGRVSRPLNANARGQHKAEASK